MAARALSAGDVIDTMFRLLKETFKSVVGVVVLLAAPGLVILTLGLILTGTLVPNAQMMERMADTGELGEIFTPTNVALLIVGAFLTWIGQAIVVPALLRIGIDHWNGRKPSIAVAVRVGLKRVWGLLAVWLVMLVLVVLIVAVPGVMIGISGTGAFGLLYILIVPSMLVFGWAVIMVGYLVPAVVVAEDIGAWKALGRVRTLLDGHFWSTYGRGMLIGFLILIVSMVFSFASNLVGFLPVEVVIILAILSSIANYVVVTPLAVYGGLALYGDLRIRSEGSDVLAMATRLKQ